MELAFIPNKPLLVAFVGIVLFYIDERTFHWAKKKPTTSRISIYFPSIMTIYLYEALSSNGELQLMGELFYGMAMGETHILAFTLLSSSVFEEIYITHLCI